MLRNFSLRIRYAISFLLIFLAMAVFSGILYEFYRANGTLSASTVALEKFTYAAQDISLISRPLDSIASLTGLENAVEFDERGNTTAVADSQIIAALSRISSQVTEGTQVLFYIRGTSDIYTESERMRYSIYETRMKNQYDLPMSQFFRHLAQDKDLALIPVLKADGTSGALARIIPITADGRKNSCSLVFLLPESLITDELERYMGQLHGDIYILDYHYNVLYRCLENDDPLVPIQKLQRRKGVGFQQYDQDHVMLSVSHTDTGLHYILCDRTDSFYREPIAAQRQFLFRIIILMLIVSVLFIWLILFNYLPIRRLTSEITGSQNIAIAQNELHLIKDSFDRSVEEVEKLSGQISGLTPLAVQSFLLRWVLGQIPDRATFDAIARYADVTLRHPCFSALYLLPPSDENADRLLQLLSGFRTPHLTVLCGSLQDENALFVILNHSEGALRASAEQILALLNKNDLDSVRIGAGSSCHDPLQLAESFREAGAAVQLSGADGQIVCYYTSQPHSQDSDSSFDGLPPMTLSLLTGAIGRGDSATALRALREITALIGSFSDSLVFFRFYTSGLINAILTAAGDCQIHYSPAELEPLISYKTIHEFEHTTSDFLTELCDRILQRQQLADSDMRDRLMGYILNHYKEYDLSVQSTALGTDLTPAQLTRIIREEIGLNFVQYVSYLRMNEFKRLLLETDRTISNLVNEIGYSDVSNFLRKFKSTEGMTAGQYRARFTETDPVE